MEAVATLAWDDGVLKASTPNLPPLAWTRPGDLAEARLNCDPPPADLDLGHGGDLLTAAFKVIPFVREPLPAPFFGGGVTFPAQEAFRLFLGINVAEKADDFRVLRGEVDDPRKFVKVGDLVTAKVLSVDWSRDRISLSIRQCQAKPLKPRTPEEIARDAEAEDVKEWMDSHPDTSSFSNIGGAFDGIKL